jgi:ATP-binding cassette subfamily F protein 3
MLKIQEMSLRRGPEPLLEEANANIADGQRVAIVGANGAGKTSLFKLLLGELSTDAGAFTLPGRCRIAHMAQEVESSPRSALDYVMDGHKAFRALEAELEQAQLSEDDQALARIHGELESIHAYNIPVEAKKLLHGLGFSEPELSESVASFSGGWRIRLNLAQALMCPSDLLLLDEPTNHLDLDAMLWLETWLKQYRGTLLFISHDRDFIDSVATSILHFEHRKLHQYTGSYSDFERQRAEKLALQQSQFQKQQQRISEIQSFVNRFRAKATKAKQAQSRLKELERMELIAPAHVDSPFKFEFPASDKQSSPLLSLSQAQLGYDPERPIIRDFSCTILPGQRIGLLGPNGAGKSTLIKSLVGDQNLLSGDRSCGEHLHIGYFAQHQLEALDLHASPILHLQRCRPTATEQEIRNFLGGFNFKGDDATGTIEKFSGGEKARLALALIAWHKPNLLLLDEPTNHLDLEMRLALTLALQAFSGAIIVVSHDRHLLKNTVDDFWLVAGGEVQPFKGDLHDYEHWLADFQKKSSGSEDPDNAGDDPEKVGETNEQRKDRKRLEAERRKQLSPLKKQLSQIEQDIEQAQTKLGSIEADLALPEVYEEKNKAKLKQLLSEQTELKNNLDDYELRWFDLHEQIDDIESSFL